ncbi:excalibur calcium-binding domain-containing protein [Streptomyces sp. M2CJ-2]|uniref:excalibur calcium-binding domain-containing protein n=1 Tax=Streptomyces sp. M2CJ-2 TaxID=2803948 RepID=UPI001F17EC59|nr:excalibur calcium-binding domain-containing protein [Streptomyces sp. M2CJ-2]
MRAPPPGATLRSREVPFTHPPAPGHSSASVTRAGARPCCRRSPGKSAEAHGSPQPWPSPGCAVRELRRGPGTGDAPLHLGEPGYGSHLDRYGDGVACEPSVGP